MIEDASGPTDRHARGVSGLEPDIPIQLELVSSRREELERGVPYFLLRRCWVVKSLIWWESPTLEDAMWWRHGMGIAT